MQGFLMGKDPEDEGSAHSPLSACHNSAPFWLATQVTSKCSLGDTWLRTHSSAPRVFPKQLVPPVPFAG